jgi:hypothetical protein
MEVDLDIFVASVIDRDNIMFVEGVNEVIVIIARGVLDSKIVNDKSELDRSSGMLPKTRDDVYFGGSRHH